MRIAFRRRQGAAFRSLLAIEWLGRPWRPTYVFTMAAVWVGQPLQHNRDCFTLDALIRSPPPAVTLGLVTATFELITSEHARRQGWPTVLHENAVDTSSFVQQGPLSCV